jgi:bile acid-coenzyme A ligase
VLRRAGWRAGQTQLLVLPLHHAAGFMCFVEGVLAGETVVLQADFVASDMWRLVARHRVGWTLLTPTHMRLALPEAGNPPALSILHTGGPCDPGLKRAWIDLLGAGNVYEMYGATEGIGTTVIRGDEWLARPGSVGRPVCGQIRILDPERAVLPADAIGEVYLRVPGRRGAPRGAPGGATTPDGFRSAGDRGWLDEDGYLFLAGRSDDMIIVGGENVYPAEIEAVLREVPGIRDVAVVGRPDPLLGERIVAYVVARGATVREDVLRYCVGRLSLRKLPKDVLFVSELPRTAAGKLQRWRLDREAPAAGAATQKMPTNTQQG